MKNKILRAAIASAICAVMAVPTVSFAAEAADDAAETESYAYRACEHVNSYQLQDDSYEATDTEGGFRHYVCSECGAEYSYETDPMVYEVNPKTGETVDQQGASNPLYENWSFCPDGEPQVFWSRPDNEWRVYVYGSHDEDGETMCGYDQILWSAPVYDLSDWRYEGVIYDVNGVGEKPFKLYAPDCDYDVTTDTYYMIANYASPENRSVLTAADNPCGPWNPNEELLSLRMRLAYDPTIYIEDGTIYIGGSAMKSGVKDEGRTDIEEAFDADNYAIKHTLAITKLKGSLTEGFEVDETVFPASDEKCYLAIYEGPSIVGYIDELDKYVIVYVSNEPSTVEGETYNSTLAYVYADDIMSDTWHYGENGVDDIIEYNGEETLSGNHGNVIYDTSGRYYKDPATGEMTFEDMPVMMYGNNHGSIVKINGNWYIFGHSPSGNGGANRRGVADQLVLEVGEDGNPLIYPAEFTSSGTSDYLDAYATWNANTACYTTAGVGVRTSKGGEGQETEEGFDQPYIVANRDAEATHASYITDIKNGSVIGYKYIGFGDSSNVSLKMLVSLPEGAVSGTAEVYIDSPDENGTQIGTIEISADSYAASTESETDTQGVEWKWITAQMDASVEGVHAVYLVFEAEDGGYICNFDQFTFVK